MHSHEVHRLQKVFTQVILEGRRQITILRSLPILNQVLISILGTIMIPFILLALTFSILLTLVFAIPAPIMCIRWVAMLRTEDSEIGVGDMKIPTLYASDSAWESETAGDSGIIAFLFCMPFVGGVFGGIHCAGWYFDFPSSAEAMLWRVSSAVLTGVAFLFPIFVAFVVFLSRIINSDSHKNYFAATVYLIIVLVYVVSRLLLLVEAFISLRHLTPGMLALVTWTSFIPHI